jgi:predicted nucleic acid-binding protein
VNVDLANRVLVDTNVVSWIGAARGRHGEWASALVGRRAFVSFVTVGEILRGGVRAGWSDAKVGEWERRLRVYTVIPGSVVVARAYARIGARFYRQVADNDLWIAATALAYDLPIATADEQLGTIARAFGIKLLAA